MTSQTVCRSTLGLLREVFDKQENIQFEVNVLSGVRGGPTLGPLGDPPRWEMTLIVHSPSAINTFV